MSPEVTVKLVELICRYGMEDQRARAVERAMELLFRAGYEQARVRSTAEQHAEQPAEQASQDHPQEAAQPTAQEAETPDWFILRQGGYYTTIRKFMEHRLSGEIPTNMVNRFSTALRTVYGVPSASGNIQHYNSAKLYTAEQLPALDAALQSWYREQNGSLRRCYNFQGELRV